MVRELHRAPFSRNQDGTDRSPAEHVEGDSLVEMIYRDLMASRISIDDCRGIIHHLSDQDAPTSQRLKGILEIKGQRTGDAENCAARITAFLRRNNRRTKSL